MKKAVNALVAIDLLFILTLCVSSVVQNAIASDTIYYLSFVVCALLGLAYIRRTRPYTENERSVYLGINKSAARYAAPLVMPIIAAVVCTSLGMNALAHAFGVSRTADVELSLISVLTHAAVPAVAEELLFRYVPMKVLLPYSKRSAVIISALCFALVHNDLFAIPYAFVAGILFALVDERCESVIPSMIIHFLNNLLSIALMASSANEAGVILIAIIVLTTASAALIFIKRREYSAFASPLFEKGETERGIGLSILPLAVVSLTLAVSALLF